MFSEFIPKKQEQKIERALLSLSLICGAVATPIEAAFAGVASPSADTEAEKIKEILKVLKLKADIVTPEQVEERSREYRENSPLAKAIEAVSPALMRAEGYEGDCEARKQRAKSQVPLLYWFRVVTLPGQDIVEHQYPVINTELFTRGVYTYYGTPQKDKLVELGFSSDDISGLETEIDSALHILTEMPVTRVSRREDATLPIKFDDTLNPDIVVTDPKTGTMHPLNGGHPMYRLREMRFFPLNKIYTMDFNTPQERGGLDISLVPLEEWKHARGYDNYPELKKYVILRNIVYLTIHEAGHWFGYGHVADKGHILNPTDSMSLTTLEKGESVPDGASVYVDKKIDWRVAVMPPFSDIRKSPIIDLNFFLKLFAKENKEHEAQNSKERFKQEAPKE